MTQSKPNILALTLTGLGVLLLIVFYCIIVFEWVTGTVAMDIPFQIITSVMIVFLVLFFFIVELPKMHSLTIADNKIIIRNLVTKKTKDILLEVIDGFKISTRVGMKTGLRFQLLLFKHDKIKETISLEYIDNPVQIMKALETHLQNLTDDQYGIFRHLGE
jgi:hypothetical protein